MHRFYWVPFGNSGMPEFEKMSLLSFAPLYQQTIWTYDVECIRRTTAGISNIMVKNANAIMPQGLAEYLVANSVDIRLVKDIISLGCLYKEGGIFTDLDLICLGRPLPVCSGFVFGTEPIKMLPRRRRRSSYLVVGGVPCGFNFGIIGAPLGDPRVKAWGGQLLSYWRNMAEDVRTGKREKFNFSKNDWQNGAFWGYNQRHIESKLAESPVLLSAALPPASCSPIPHWMRSWPASHSAERPVAYISLPVKSHGYEVPTLARIADIAPLINTWKRQWGPDSNLMDDAIDFCEQVSGIVLRSRGDSDYKIVIEHQQGASHTTGRAMSSAYTQTQSCGTSLASSFLEALASAERPGHTLPVLNGLVLGFISQGENMIFASPDDIQTGASLLDLSEQLHRRVNVQRLLPAPYQRMFLLSEAARRAKQTLFASVTTIQVIVCNASCTWPSEAQGYIIIFVLKGQLSVSQKGKVLVKAGQGKAVVGDTFVRGHVVIKAERDDTAFVVLYTHQGIIEQRRLQNHFKQKLKDLRRAQKALLSSRQADSKRIQKKREAQAALTDTIFSNKRLRSKLAGMS